MGYPQNNLEMNPPFESKVSVPITTAEGSILILTALKKHDGRVMLDVEYHSKTKSISGQFSDFVELSYDNVLNLKHFAQALGKLASNISTLD